MPLWCYNTREIGVSPATLTELEFGVAARPYQKNAVASGRVHIALGNALYDREPAELRRVGAVPGKGYPPGLLLYVSLCPT